MMIENECDILIEVLHINGQRKW